jgi:hypothetical protein
MPYSMLVRRIPGDDDARLYPALVDPRTVAMDPIDGESLLVKAESVAVREVSSEGLRVDAEIRGPGVDVLITDARVVFRCLCPESAVSGYPLVEPTSILMSESSGELVLGQIRYAWLRCVGARPRTGWRARDDLRLGVVVRSSRGGLRELFLDLRLVKGTKAPVIADAIVTRATRYLAGTGSSLDQELHAELDHVGALSLRDQQSPQFIFSEMPEFAVVSAATAYPAGLSSQGVQRARPSGTRVAYLDHPSLRSCPKDGTE